MVKDSISLPTPTREGYTFTGWSVSGNGTVLSGENLTIGAGNVTLTANWQLIPI